MSSSVNSVQQISLTPTCVHCYAYGFVIDHFVVLVERSSVCVCLSFRMSTTPGNLMEFKIAPGNNGNLLEFS